MKPTPKPPPAPAPPRASTLTNRFKNRDGLGAYTADPAAFPPSRVIYHDDRFVAIHDLYPKATIHTLLLSRSPAHTLLHPFDALDDPAFLADVQAEALRLRALVAKELRRRLGAGSERERRRERALAEQQVQGGGGGGEVEIPAGRDWEAEIRVGIHSRPSMNHLHVHVFSRDMHSPCMKHRKHYNSFNTPFLIDVADFPLAKDDPRRHPGHQGYLDRSLRCWRCGKEFGNKFKALKDHLEEEFEEWKRE